MLRIRRRFLVLLLDLFFIAAAYYLAILLRFDFVLSSKTDPFLYVLPIILLLKAVVFVSSRLYRSMWRYASLPDAIEIFKTVSLASGVSWAGLVFLHEAHHFSRSIFLLDWGILLCLVVTSRLVWRVYRETHIIPRRSAGARTIIVGAGDAGNLLLKELLKSGSGYKVVGFVDDDPSKRNMRLNGVPVIGATAEICSIVADNEIENVIIAMPSANRKIIREIVKSCERAKVKFKTLPGIGDLIDGSVSVSQIKDVEIEDLLGRDPVVLDEDSIGRYLTGKRVLVTGAAGSIGSEICRQVARFRPAKIVLFDAAETPLFFLDKEMAAGWPGVRILPVIGDVRNRGRVEAVFEAFAPQVVFHAAAYKHVPMMEYNPVEAVTNNVGGTKVLADAAHVFGVENFVMISTDKAVNPTNVMGTTKRVAERYVQGLSRRSATRFSTVRFGNVLGSNGSVIPLFKQQIREGKAVTVTDPKVIRYFMTIPEATQLVVQAGGLGKGGEIFVLNMGEPVRILELAEELIRLSGLVPYEDIDIKFTGLRPGEKLFEELLVDGEGIKPTVHEKIKVLAPVATDFTEIAAEVEVLFRAVAESNLLALMDSLRRLVPEYKPQYDSAAKASPAFLKLRPDVASAEAPAPSAPAVSPEATSMSLQSQALLKPLR
jgi:FlaA1/EpsC-like NDP-sugar epimerase